MRRREVLALLGGPIVFAPEMVWAQSLRGMRRIGVMMQLAENDPAAQAQLTALSEGLAELGWEVGKNIQIEYRTTTSDPNTIASKASELILTRPEILLAVPFVNVAELRRQSPTTPLIFIHFADPVRLGLVDAIARPGGNTTGFMGFAPTMLEKWIEC